jgi:hypothetical protein
MTWRLEWSIVAERDLRELPWRTAARLDAAVMRYAATGRGSITRIEPADPHRLRLRVDGAEARLFLDANERAIYVARVFRRR